MKLVNVNVNYIQVFVIISNVGIMINADVNEWQQLIDKRMCYKGFIWNPSNCECERDKLCDVGEHLDCKSCKCRKRLIDKLVEKCNENTDGNEVIYNSTLNAIPLNDYRKICNSCTVYIVLLAIFFIIIVSISSIFICFHWYLKKRYTETTIYQTYIWEISKKLTLKSNILLF